MRERGTYLTYFLGGADADKPTLPTVTANFGFYWAVDTGVLYARQVGETTWTPLSAGAITPQPDIPDITGDPGEGDFNGLLAALRAAGVLKV